MAIYLESLSSMVHFPFNHVKELELKADFLSWQKSLYPGSEVLVPLIQGKITRILAANICRQFFFVITTTASTRCLVENSQLIYYLQRVNATSQYNSSGSSRCSKWPNDRMVAVVKHCWLIVQETRGCGER